ncbi:unnamed protein product [Acanthoscelides obtectus]|uniref:Uncharacterized protein n=1 Tax=Acanthoscelides obtectus TaxID=200917 RepID=A0A9P0L0Q4_ACAOB|nr:unnamed protein product [Acanthoscelides obtectus]CAK1643379.1 hypothetical protein AOBTE_LOCUS13511 [Acanthoscelides obtectus]
MKKRTSYYAYTVKKKVVNVVKCKKCNNSFHPACLEQAGELKNTNCMHESSKVRRESVNMLLCEDSTELDLLRTLVKELQSKIESRKKTVNF